MSNGIRVEFKGSKEQFAAFTMRCEMTEQLFSMTLAERIEGMKAEQALPFIQSWFESVRNMTVAHWISSGIEAKAESL